MAGPPRLAIIIASLFYVLLCSALAANQQYMAAAPHVFRYATVDDVDDITTLWRDAFSPAPPYDYIHQFRDKYPDTDWECMRLKFRLVLESEEYVSRVIAVPDESSLSGSRVVSYSAWRLNRTRGYGESSDSTLQLSALGRLNCSPPLDTNVTRANDVQKRIYAVEEKYLDGVYERHVYLAGLATHPTWDGNEFAAAHLHWGLAVAGRLGLPTTLLGTPAGHPLYRSVGFDDIYNLTIQRLDGQGEFWYEVMARPA